MSYYKKTAIIVGFATMPMIANALSYEVGVELGNTNLNRNNLNWYVPYSTGGATSIGTGDFGDIEPSSDQRLTIDLGLDLGNNWTLSLRSSSVEFSESDALTTNFEASATRVHANFDDVADGDWDSGTAEYELEETSIDVELAYSLRFGANGQGSFSPLFGFRTLSIEQAFDTLYNDTTSTDGNTVTESIESDGMGFFAGAEIVWQFNKLIGFEGRVEVGTLQVDTSRENIEYNSIGAAVPTLHTSVDDSFSESATTTAASLGVSIQTYDNDKVNIVTHLGYEISTVNGLSDFINFPDDVVDSKTSRNLQSLGYDGIYLGLTGTF